MKSWKIIKAAKSFWDNIRPLTNKEIEERYLAAATDLIDLENRIKKIDRGQAPFQYRYN